MLLTFALLTIGQVVSAQEVARPVLEGRVSRDDVGVGGTTVILHRVTVDSAGEIDSVAAAPDGAFSFELPSVPDPGGRGEVYFASTDHHGVTYFGAPIHLAVQLDSLYTIPVFDTAVAPAGGADLTVERRVLILEPQREAWSVTDVFIVRNDLERTLVAAPGDAVWSYPLPVGLEHFVAGTGDSDVEGVDLVDGAVRVRSAVPPGSKDLVARYAVGELPLDVPLRGRHPMEVFVPEGGPTLEIDGLERVDPVEFDAGLVYDRYATEATTTPTLSVRLGRPPVRVPVEWMAVGLAFVLMAVTFWGLRAGGRGQPAEVSVPATVPAPALEHKRRLVLEVARIDERLAELETGDPGRARLEGERSQLVGRIRQLG